jgi:hypothetical protein
MLKLIPDGAVMLTGRNWLLLIARIEVDGGTDERQARRAEGLP